MSDEEKSGGCNCSGWIFVIVILLFVTCCRIDEVDRKFKNLEQKVEKIDQQLNPKPVEKSNGI